MPRRDGPLPALLLQTGPSSGAGVPGGVIVVIEPLLSIGSGLVGAAPILDVFNEYRGQIMTPAYEDDPEQRKVVPKEQWYVAPARPPASNTPVVEPERTHLVACVPNFWNSTQCGQARSAVQGVQY